MSENDKDYQILRHIIKYCEKIQQSSSVFKGKYVNFINSKNYAVRDACCFYLLQIGELTGNLTDEFKTQNPKIPWKEIRSLRNIVAHRYGTVEFGTIWEIMSDDVPVLNSDCRQVLRKSAPQLEKQLQKELADEIGLKVNSLSH
jgi:uncharacterized protein with HEPN domain